jgi:dipeptidase D
MPCLYQWPKKPSAKRHNICHIKLFSLNLTKLSSSTQNLMFMLENIAPQEIWQHFSALNAVPRPSKKEEKVIAFVQQFGQSLGLETITDAVGNVIIKKPATPGMENRKTVVLQSHLDMVHQKNNGVDFDFDTQGIEMYIDGDWIKAKGTTLGADNGIGVASIMAILLSKDIPHPALEALFTIDEETGMTGAINLKPGLLTGEIMLNLDTEEDDEIDIGCAGGVDITLSKTYQTWSAAPAKALQISIKGLQGGHSGMDIHKGLGNANVLLSRFLFEALPHNAQLIALAGGSLRNAIPRESQAILLADASFIAQFESLKKDILAEYASVEPGLDISLTEVENTQKALAKADSQQAIATLRAMHHGVMRMSPDIADLVESSNNLAKITLNESKFELCHLSRSSVDSTKTEVGQRLSAIALLAGMDCQITGAYPGWKPKPEAEIIKVMAQLYRERFGQEARVVACHAGLECGIIGANYPQMEMVSFGPNIRGAHSPDERVSISSVQKFWGYLQAVLANIPTK